MFGKDFNKIGMLTYTDLWTGEKETLDIFHFFSRLNVDNQEALIYIPNVLFPILQRWHLLPFNWWMYNNNKEIVRVLTDFLKISED